MDYQLPEDLWPHQRSGIEETMQAVDSGQRRLVLTGACGAGKTRMMTELIQLANSRQMPVALYTSRRMLFDQTAGVLERFGIEFGLRAAKREPALDKPVQLAMTQSEYSAVYKRHLRSLHPASLVLIDEIHMQGGGMMEEIIKSHYASGAAVVAFTATPLDLMGEWDRLIVAGRNSELRKCGAHVPAITFCPDVPDLKHIKKYKIGEDLTDKENHAAIMRPGVFGRIHQHWKRLNPEGKATILFAPDVAGSLFFAKQFYQHGIRAAHIDASEIWLDEITYDSTDEKRAEVLAMSQSGEVQVLCNRFVLREGIDLPHIAHCIMACVFGSLTSYLQSGGRVIRSHPSLTEVTVQDHGGNYIRHGSLNADRDWELGQSGYKTTGLRQDAMREKPEMEPIICPKCNAARLSGAACMKCGHRYEKRSRMVVEVNGSLKQVEGPSFKPHRIKQEPDTAKKWEQMYYRGKSKKWDATFKQVEALFQYEHHYYPPRNLPLMPKDPIDWFEKVSRVPKERLN